MANAFIDDDLMWGNCDRLIFFSYRFYGNQKRVYILVYDLNYFTLWSMNSAHNSRYFKTMLFTVRWMTIWYYHYLPACVPEFITFLKRDPVVLCFYHARRVIQNVFPNKLLALSVLKSKVRWHARENAMFETLDWHMLC